MAIMGQNSVTGVIVMRVPRWDGLRESAIKEGV